MNIFNKKLIATALTALMLNACSDDSNYDFTASQQAANDAANDAAAAAALAGTNTFTPDYDPTTGKVPFPSNLLLSGGSVNIPTTASTVSTDPRFAANKLDGFSTTSPITLAFTQAIDPSSVILGESVYVYELETTGTTPTGKRALAASEVLATVTSGNTLTIVPLAPLKESTTYLVVATNAIKSAVEGNNVNAQESLIYTLLSSSPSDTDVTVLSNDPTSQQTLLGLQSLINGYEALAGIPNTIVSWSFTTQSITPYMEALADKAKQAESIALNGLSLVNTNLTANQILDGLTDQADIYIGTLGLPYYLGIPSAESPIAPLTDDWSRSDGMPLRLTTDESESIVGELPQETGSQIIPVLASIPNTGTAPYPVVIFQHGVTSDRTAMLGVINSYTAAGHAVIAIDMPLHGLTPGNPSTADTYQALSVPTAALGASERTFDVDYFNNTNGAAGPDGNVDSSGASFINLSSLTTSRDNIRQAVADLMVLRQSIAGATVNNNNNILNGDDVKFTGHSLGAIVGTTYLAADNDTNVGVLGMGGSQIVPFLEASPTFGPAIKAGLAASGIVEGTSDYSQFLLLAQTVLDAADPANFASLFIENNNKALITEIVGGNGNLPDQVISNTVANNPLSGTEPQARLLGLTPIRETTTVTNSGHLIRYNAGTHASLVSPGTPERDSNNNEVINTNSDDFKVYSEIQTQIGSFIGSNGVNITITNDTYIAE